MGCMQLRFDSGYPDRKRGGIARVRFPAARHVPACVFRKPVSLRSCGGAHLHLGTKIRTSGAELFVPAIASLKTQASTLFIECRESNVAPRNPRKDKTSALGEKAGADKDQKTASAVFLESPRDHPGYMPGGRGISTASWTNQRSVAVTLPE